MAEINIQKKTGPGAWVWIIGIIILAIILWLIFHHSGTSTTTTTGALDHASNTLALAGAWLPVRIRRAA
jgi:hypothetical protein